MAIAVFAVLAGKTVNCGAGLMRHCVQHHVYDTFLKVLGLSNYNEYERVSRAFGLIGG
jgi:hypothetical protein